MCKWQTWQLVHRLQKDIFLKSRTVKMANELLVVYHLLHHIYLYFLKDVKVQLYFSKWYVKTIVLRSNSCKDITNYMKNLCVITSVNILMYEICLCCLNSLDWSTTFTSISTQKSLLKSIVLIPHKISDRIKRQWNCIVNWKVLKQIKISLLLSKKKDCSPSVVMIFKQNL